jgi:hypothetical protein
MALGAIVLTAYDLVATPLRQQKGEQRTANASAPDFLNETKCLLVRNPFFGRNVLFATSNFYE